MTRLAIWQIYDFTGGYYNYTPKQKSGKRTDYNSDAESPDIPIVILINENSASASEVFTGALKDYGKATVVGKKSYGKGIVQSVLPFYDGSGNVAYRCKILYT